jgi:Amt family ammonium transporter
MKKLYALLLTLGLAHFGALTAGAQDPAAPPTTPPAETAAPAPAPVPAPAETPAPAPPEAAPAPAPTAAESDILAYFNNVAPAGPLAGIPGPGHNAFIMICAALVLFMTLPGLALFYGGLVRSKNVLSVMAQCLGIAGLVAMLWFAFGYSLVFGEHTTESTFGFKDYFGSAKYFFLDGVDGKPNTNYAGWPSHSVFCMFQLMFAIITPALIIGAIAERMKFGAVLAFVGIWMFVVYFPMAHMVWGFDGKFNGVWNGGATLPGIDFAGGTVVHMTSGWSALVLCILLGKRRGFGKQPMQPHSMVLCMVGTGMLWVGWYGFNAGSALAADGLAAQAFATTTICAAVASFVWAALEWVIKKKPSVLGFCSGAVAGLVVITPAAGFVSLKAAFIMGILAGVVPFLACTKLKQVFGYDDSLDTFGIHGIGGTMGALLTAWFANAKVNANLISDGYAGPNGLAYFFIEKGTKAADGKFINEDGSATGGLLMNHIWIVLITIALSVVATAVIAFIVKAVIGLRSSEETETAGLDLADHGEEGYHNAA